MRSSKSRSRSKSNRQRTIGNIVNRVFDSSGPEGKVRGTPQQIIDKYLALARDAQLSNDRVAEQNFLQHAEHYTRMLGEATREMQREQEARQAQQGQHGNQPQHQQGDRNGRDRDDTRDRDDHRGGDRGEAPGAAPGAADVIDMADEGESTLVETPEAVSGDQPDGEAEDAAPQGEEAQADGQQRAPRRDRRPRGPRRPRGQGGDGPRNEEPSAAE